MNRDDAQKALVQLARQSAHAWRSIRGEAFVGDTTIETGNTIYRFKDGVFSGRAPKTNASAFESPVSMIGVELIGFLTDEGGLWSLSPRWREGSFAVLTSLHNGGASSFTLTSATSACMFERPTALPKESALAPPPEHQPPMVRRPPPLSMTRIQPVPAR